MVYLLCYDIKTNSIRSKIAKKLIENGFERIQKSVYLATTNPQRNKILWNTLEKLILQDKGVVLVIPLSKNNFRSLKKIGIFELDIAFLLGEKHSLII